MRKIFVSSAVFLIISYLSARVGMIMIGDVPFPGESFIFTVLFCLLAILNLYIRKKAPNIVSLKRRWAELILSVILGFCFVIGYALDFSENRTFKFVSGSPVKIVLAAFLFSYYFFMLMVWFDLFFEKKNGQTGSPADSDLPRNSLRSGDPKRIVRVLAIVLFAGWMPYLICNLPGSLANDSRDQLKIILNLAEWSNHNPVLVTLIYGALFQSGRAVFGTDNSGITVIAVFQLILMSFSFSLLLYEAVCLISNDKIKRIFLVISSAFYIFVPIFGGAGQIVLKDSLHTPFFIMMTASQMDIIRNPSRKMNKVFYCLFLILTSLSRAMAMLYAFAGVPGMIYIIYKKSNSLPDPAAAGKNKRGIAVSVGSAALFVAVWTYVLLPLFGVKSYPSYEKYSLPFQQVSYVVVNHYEELDEKDLEAIDNVISTDEILRVYKPNLADPVKKLYQDGDMDLFWKVYFKWYTKYPVDMIKGLFTSYYKYLYPYSIGYGNFRQYIGNCSKLGIDVHYVLEKARALIRSYVDFWETNPILMILMGPGLYIWILLYSFVKAIQKKSAERLTILLPFIFLFLGLFLTPVNGETRYALPIIAGSPMLIILGASQNSLS